MVLGPIILIKVMSPLVDARPETHCILQTRAIFHRQLQVFADFLDTVISLLV